MNIKEICVDLTEFAHEYYSSNPEQKKELLKSLGITQVTFWKRCKDAGIDVDSIRKQYQVKYGNKQKSITHQRKIVVDRKEYNEIFDYSKFKA